MSSQIEADSSPRNNEFENWLDTELEKWENPDSMEMWTILLEKTDLPEENSEEECEPELVRLEKMKLAEEHVNLLNKMEEYLDDLTTSTGGHENVEMDREMFSEEETSIDESLQNSFYTFQSLAITIYEELYLH